MFSSEINWIRKPLQAGISQKKMNKICYLTQWSCLKNTLVFQAKMQISIVIWLLVNGVLFFTSQNAKINLKWMVSTSLSAATSFCHQMLTGVKEGISST